MTRRTCYYYSMLKQSYLNTKKAKKTQQVRAYFQKSLGGFYSFLIIGRAVTVHCFFARLEVLKQLEKEKQ